MTPSRRAVRAALFVAVALSIAAWAFMWVVG
jgi:hypothetical protein